MGKENQSKTDSLAWIKALLFPQKSKPISAAQPLETPARPAQTPPAQPAPAAPKQNAPQPPSPSPFPGIKLSHPATPASAAPASPSQPAPKPAASPAAPASAAPASPSQPAPKPAASPAAPASAAPASPSQPAPKPAASPAAPASAAPIAAAVKPPISAENQAGNLSQPVEKKRKFLPAFWTIASILSMIVNLVLIIILLIVGRELFTLKALVGDQLLGGLYHNFVLMNEAHIKTTILVESEVPVQFVLPVQTNTTVQLTEDTRITNARVTLTTGGLNIVNAPTNIILPAGTNLPIALDITVPVNTTIPIALEVPVDIPLAETELREPFVGLQGVVGPYYKLLDNLPDAHEIPLCQANLWLCRMLFTLE